MDNSRIAFDRIAETLLSEYTSIYYVDMKTNEYQWYSSDEDYRSISVKPAGSDFFADVEGDVDNNIHEDDKQLIKDTLKKETLLDKVSKGEMKDIVYRLIIRGKPVYHTLKIIRGLSEDSDYLIVCVLNIDKEYREKLEAIENARKLADASRMARRDELTGIRNKNAYKELEAELDDKLKNGTMDGGVAIVVFDMNDLKIINDTKGHTIGDDYLRKASIMICNTFSHSPVFRTGGDEFVAIVSDDDYIDREYLIAKFKLETIKNGRERSGPVVACGMSECNFDLDERMSDVFERADKAMYEDKDHLKAMRQRDGYYNTNEDRLPVPDGRKRMLNELFNAIKSVTHERYVYVLDIRYDYSRWSNELAKDYRMKDEYLYGAGAIWESHIHPDDMPLYRRALDGIFFDNTGARQIHYRVCNYDGEYINCYTRGFVMCDEEGEPDFFGGIIVPE